MSMTEKRPRRDDSVWGRRHPTADPCRRTAAESEFAALRRGAVRGLRAPAPPVRPRSGGGVGGLARAARVVAGVGGGGAAPREEKRGGAGVAPGGGRGPPGPRLSRQGRHPPPPRPASRGRPRGRGPPPPTPPPPMATSC